MDKEQNIIEFSRALIANRNAKIAYDKLKNPTSYDKDIKYRFSVSIKEIGDYVSGYSNEIIIMDEDDIRYFTLKYLPKLKEEMQKKIDEVVNTYTEACYNE